MKTRYAFILGALAALALAVACSAAPQQAAAPPATGDNRTAAAPTTPPPIVKGIVGSVEWAPSSKGTLACIAFDPHGLDMTYAWSANSGTLTGEGKQVTWTAPDEPGSYTVSVTVTDSAGAQSTATRDIAVVSNPLRNQVQDETIYLKFTFPSSGTVQATKKVVIQTISDIQCTFPNSDPGQLTLTWSAPVGKLMGTGIDAGTATRVGWLAPGVPGQYTVNVKVSDNLGRTATGSVNFDVIPMAE